MRRKDTIFILDDEPYYLDWLVDFIRSEGYKCELVATLGKALAVLRKERFRMVIADLNVPAEDSVLPALDERGPLYRQFPGLYAAYVARNYTNHTGRQVIVYSVHDNEAVRNETRRLQCTYILKGRPRSFKQEICDVLSYDPLADQA
jgi:CheY-like chemotaxis protein